MTAQHDSAEFEARVICPGCDGAQSPIDSPTGFLPCLHCNGQGWVTLSHAGAINAGRRLMRWVRITGMPMMYFARAFGLDARQLADVMWAREPMPAELDRSLAFFERTSPARFAEALVSAGPEIITCGARAIHDGPVGGNDVADFDSPKGKAASDWCREVFATGLRAVAVARFGNGEDVA